MGFSGSSRYKTLGDGTAKAEHTAFARARPPGVPWPPRLCMGTVLNLSYFSIYVVKYPFQHTKYQCVHADPFDNAKCKRYSKDPAHHKSRGAQKSFFVTEKDYNYWRLSDPSIWFGMSKYWRCSLTPHMVKILNRNLKNIFQPGDKYQLLAMLNHKKLSELQGIVSDLETVVVDHRNRNTHCYRSDIKGLALTQSVSPPQCAVCTVCHHLEYQPN